MPLLNPASFGLNNHIIHCGYLRSVTGSEVRAWPKEDLMPNILYMNNGQIADSMFGGLLFEADRSINEEILSSKAIGFGKPPTLSAWQQSIDMLLQKDQNLMAALQLSALRPQAATLDIWLALPYPMETSQEFGKIQGRQLNFQANPADRELALKWWIDQAIAGWDQITSVVSVHNARLCGFAWTKNSLESNDEQIIVSISQYLHAKSLKFIWCQNYGTAKAWEGYQFGFDCVFARPLYMNKEPRGANWITSAVKFSTIFNCGIIVWGDPRVSSNQLSDFLNIGRSQFIHAFQVFEIGEAGALHLYQTSDPLYDTLYAYLKGS